MASVFDIDIKQGATFSSTVTLKDSDGNALNLTGYSVRSQIRATPESDLILKIFDTTIALPATLGKINWSLSATDTAELEVDRTSPVNQFQPTIRCYDLEIESPSGVVTCVLQGNVNVIPGVTRT